MAVGAREAAEGPHREGGTVVSELATFTPEWLIKGKRSHEWWRENVAVPWDFFLGLRAWAKWVAVETGSHAYLVGSALDHDRPRDIDVAFVWTAGDWKRHFGVVPTSGQEYTAMHDSGFRYAVHAFVVSAWEGIGYKPYIDVHLCLEGWYDDKPRLLLGSPTDIDRRTAWDGKDFGMREVSDVHGETVFRWPVADEATGYCWREPTQETEGSP